MGTTARIVKRTGTETGTETGLAGMACAILGHEMDNRTLAGDGPRHGLTEYACGCGHSFLLAPRGLARVTHPLICAVSGHRVVFVERRQAYREHRCVDCGHTFGVAA